MPGPAWVTKLERRHRQYFAGGRSISFAVQPLVGPLRVIGPDFPAFTFTIRHPRGEAALESFDQFSIATAYVEGFLEVDGDLMAAMLMRRFFRDVHPLRWAGRVAAGALANPGRDQKSISAHYDRDPDFFLMFLDQRHRCYTQGSFIDTDEPLEDAITRKLELAYEAVGLKPGDHALDIGSGWGAFAEYAAGRGTQVTSLTLSADSEGFLREMAARRSLPITVVRKHFLAFESPVRFDAIINMGTTEHLPQYRATLQAYADLLKPDGYIYLDALAMRSRYRVSSFMNRYIYPGSSSPLVLHRYLCEVARSPLVLTSLHNERRNYQLTCVAWARRLDAAREKVVARWGEALYRKFRLFLWGSAASFAVGQVQAYKWVLHLPCGVPEVGAGLWPAPMGGL